MEQTYGYMIKRDETNEESAPVPFPDIQVLHLETFFESLSTFNAHVSHSKL